MKAAIHERLQQALDMLPICSCIADIGSDHGWASIRAVQTGIAQRVIATDISEASLQKTRDLVKLAGLEQQIECRRGDGLNVLKKGEAEAALIAGMGSELIADIVLQGKEISFEMRCLVLQPMNEAAPLRKRLAEGGFCICKEAIVLEKGHFYQTLMVKKGAFQRLSPIEEELGTFIFREKVPLCGEFVEARLKKLEKAVDSIGKYGGPQTAERKEQLKRKIEEYREVLAWIAAK